MSRYGLLPPVALVHADNDLGAPPYRAQPSGLYDAIITDPPYGVREMLAKLDDAPLSARTLQPEHLQGHTPKRSQALGSNPKPIPNPKPHPDPNPDPDPNPHPDPTPNPNPSPDLNQAELKQVLCDLFALADTQANPDPNPDANPDANPNPNPNPNPKPNPSPSRHAAGRRRPPRLPAAVYGQPWVRVTVTVTVRVRVRG